MNALDTFNKPTGRSNLGEPVTAVLAVASIATKLKDVLSKVKAFKKVADAIKKLTSFLNVPDESDFIYCRDKVDTWTNTYNYSGGGVTKANFRILAADIPDKKSKGETYEAEYRRLQQWLVAKMNAANPGLGDLWLEFFPEVKMKDQEESDWNNWNAAKVFMSAFPPGTFNINKLTPAELQVIRESLRDGNADVTNTVANSSDLLTQVVNGYKVIKDATGQVKAIYNAAGQLINPSTAEYQEVVSKIPEPQQAGMGTAGKILIGVLGFSALTFIATQSGGHSKPVKRSELNGPRKKKRKKSKSANS
jgi:hypothetical protein